MRDRGIILTGLVVFLALVSYPVWHNLAAGVATRGPEPVLPKTEKQCVRPVAFMKTSHMQLLKDWRDAAIREGQREEVAPDGRHFAVSLTNTCLRQCHAEKAEFCDRCHNYAAVSVSCWDCHQDTKPGAPFAAGAAGRMYPASAPTALVGAGHAPGLSKLGFSENVIWTAKRQRFRDPAASVVLRGPSTARFDGVPPRKSLPAAGVAIWTASDSVTEPGFRVRSSNTWNQWLRPSNYGSRRLIWTALGHARPALDLASFSLSRRISADHSDISEI